MQKIIDTDIKKLLFFLILITTAIRLFVASTLEFSVDEVYYWTYALYPDWSHFDHPPMVGWIIQLFTLNLLLDSELAIRLGAIVLSGFNTYIIFLIGKHIKNPATGFYAAILLNTSIYCSVLAGNFIIPDSPQLFFWLLSLYFILKSVPEQEYTSTTRINFLLACLFIGLSIISKYHGVFIWAGLGLYVLVYQREWLQRPVFYVGMFLSALFTFPIIIWNIQNNWISFNFHGDRVKSEFAIRLDYFFTEIFGQVAYNNPINYVIIILTLIAIYKGRLNLAERYKKILLFNAFPIWMVFTGFALFRSTLPHWTGPAFTPLIVLAAAFLSQKNKDVVSSKSIRVPSVLRSSLILIYGALLLAWLLINFFPGTIGKTEKIAKYGDTDFTLDMYGWDQIKEGFLSVDKKMTAKNKISADAPIVSPKYFPGTEIDYYIAKPMGKKLLQMGTLAEIHKYAWINRERGELKTGEDAYMISTSNWYKDPYERYGRNFDEIIPIDTIGVTRSGKIAYFAFIYQLKNYKGNFPDPFE